MFGKFFPFLVTHTHRHTLNTKINENDENYFKNIKGILN